MEYYQKNKKYRVEKHSTHIDVFFEGTIVTRFCSKGKCELTNEILQMPLQELINKNLEVFRAVIEFKGWGAALKEFNAAPTDEDTDEYGNRIALYAGQITRDTQYSWESGVLPIKLLEVVCPSTKRVYFIPVHPDCGNVWGAVASTFGMEANEYKPLIQT
jgi:hypothetical protein